MNQSGYRKDIDGLRAIAVGLVLLFHAGLGFAGGFIGVDVFFVISGYLITRILRQQVVAGTFKFTDFWNRRIRRIVPAAFIMTVAVLVVGVLVMEPKDLESLAKSSIAQQLMVANMYFARHTNYFATASELFPLLHTWSLGVEEQFYLFYPWFLVFLLKGKKSNPARGILILGVISFIAGLVITFVEPNIAFYYLPFRAWELMVGGWLAVRAETSMPAKKAGIISASGLVLIIASSLLLDVHVAFPGYWAILPVLGTALVIHGGSGNTTSIQRLLSLPAVRLVGKASYSIYLWHWPIFAFMRYWYGLHLDWKLSILGLVGSLILGFASWRLIEEPIRKTRGSFRNAASGLVAATLLFGALAGYVVYKKGLPARHVEQENWNRLADLSNLGMIYESGQEGPQGVQVLRLGEGSDQDPSFAIWGDSHAMVLAEFMDEIASMHGCHGWIVSRGGSPPLLGVNTGYRGKGFTTSLDEWSRESFEVLKASGVKHVLMVGRWAAYMEGIPSVQVPDLQIRPASLEHHEPTQRVFKKSFEATIEALDAAGITVTFVEQPPLQNCGIQRRSFIRSLWGLPIGNERATSWEDHRDRQSKVSVVVDEFAASGKIQVMKLRQERYEASGKPEIHRDGTTLYLDDDHLSTDGVRHLFGDQIVSWITDVCADRDQNPGQ